MLKPQGNVATDERRFQDCICWWFGIYFKLEDSASFVWFDKFNSNNKP